MTQVNLGGRLLSLDRPIVMGILNFTQDSFYDGGKYNEHDKAIDRIGVMLDEGAQVIDIGAFSSRPGAQIPTPEDQLENLLPLVESVVKHYPEVNLSIDTYSSKVVSQLAEICPFIVNDISAAEWDEDLLAVVAQKKLPYVLMHMRGKPTDMASRANYDKLVMDLVLFFSAKLRLLDAHGIKDIFIDPGFGFAKNRKQNFELLAKLQAFQIVAKPILVGLSNKSFIYKTLEVTKDAAVNGTTAMHMVALMNGAKVLRVHNVKEAAETINLWTELNLAVND